MTGVAALNVDLIAKRLELLHELVPMIGTVAVLLNPNSAYTEPETRHVQAAALSAQVQVLLLTAGNESEISSAFGSLAQQRVGALIVSADPFFTSHRDQLVALAARHTIPTIYQWREFTEAGGLISYGADRIDTYRQTGIYVGRVLSGIKPTDLPVMQPTKFELVLNRKTAKALGLTFPITLLGRAGARGIGEDVVPRVMLTAFILGLAGHGPQLFGQDQRIVRGLDIGGFGPELAAITPQRVNIDLAGLNRPEAPVPGLRLQIFVFVCRADQDTASRCINAAPAVSWSRSVVASARKGFDLLNLATFHASEISNLKNPNAAHEFLLFFVPFGQDGLVSPWSAARWPAAAAGPGRA
jgi:hypothetical protein